MYKAFAIAEAPLTPTSLQTDLELAGFEVVAASYHTNKLVHEVIRYNPDFVVAATVSPSVELIEAAKSLVTLAPCPFIVFTSDGDSAKIEKASDSGIHAYVVDGYAKQRLYSIIQVARARFRHEQLLRDELQGLSKRFEERKLVDRAKGLLMRSRGITEEAAFELLRNLAMRTRQRIGLVAQSVIDMSRAGEAVNRSGQLRMLSQRIVKCYAQALYRGSGLEQWQILRDCVDRIELNLGILHKALSVSGYKDLVDRVALSWKKLADICACLNTENASGDPSIEQINQLTILDSGAEAMLQESERLTEFLGSTGLVASLHILNVAGRQRMLSQRIAKDCLLVGLQPSEKSMQSLQNDVLAFQQAMQYLEDAPLSSQSIRVQLGIARSQWAQLEQCLSQLNEPSSYNSIMQTSESLLQSLERLTDEYEQALQVLIGNSATRMF